LAAFVDSSITGGGPFRKMRWRFASLTMALLRFGFWFGVFPLSLFFFLAFLTLDKV
jgi:hypothetical protein